MYEGLYQSCFDPVVEKDASDVVPLEKEFEVEACAMKSEPLDDDCWNRGKKEMDEEDGLSGMGLPLTWALVRRLGH